LLALSNAIEKADGELQLNDEFKVSSNYIKNNYLLNSNEDGDRRFKLILTQSDRDTYLNLLQNLPLPTEVSKRIVENYEFFEDKLSEVNLKDVYVGIQKLMIVEIALDRSTDNPQLIFESLNSTGLELSQADLIRNFILMGLEPEHQKRIYNEFWFPMERRFGHAEYSSYFDRFMRDYLTIKLGRIPNIQDVHREFKFHSQSDEDRRIEDIVADIYKYSEYFVNMVLNKEPNALLKKIFESINELKVDVAYPLLLEVYNDYKAGAITQQDFVEILLMLESYVFRRAICGIPTNSMNKTFATLYKEVDKENYLESFKAALLVKDSYRRFPSNDEFMRELMTKNIYKSRNTNYLLSKLENSRSSKESINLGQFSIEHILPQNPNLSEQWQSDLGANWKEIQEKYLHTLGNLTLTGYNTELSDRPFTDKRDMRGGFKDSRLFLNSQLDELTKWTEEDINLRAERLTSIARDIWTIPKLDESILQKYRKAKETKRTPSAYTLDDYKHMTGFRLELFSRVKEKILQIDPAVTEQCNKYYIAFRTADESNFVAIVAQKSRLRITLNIDNENLKDPKGICSNVEDLGYWGGGQRSLFGLTKDEDIDYAIDLIKQSFDYVANE
jgi:uncharacterized protein with ParB-like and HNH nuclease domain/predicted transport protein